MRLLIVSYRNRSDGFLRVLRVLGAFGIVNSSPFLYLEPKQKRLVTRVTAGWNLGQHCALENVKLLPESNFSLRLSRKVRDTEISINLPRC